MFHGLARRVHDRRQADAGVNGDGVAVSFNFVDGEVWHIDNDAIAHWQVTIKIGFTLE